jgi:heptosyltransferase III
MNRILVIRGGAIGDFLLTLPALKLLRDAFPSAHLEILGYKHIIALAENRGYADSVRSIDYAPLASFFSRDGELPAELAQYFRSFQQIISYLFDPDEVFANNLKRCDVKNLIKASPQINDGEHAARQLARPLEQLGLFLEDAAAMLYPNKEDRMFAKKFLERSVRPLLALHPGSGGERKNWALENWRELGDWLIESTQPSTLLVVIGEADESRAQELKESWAKRPVCYAQNLPLPQLAALLEQCAVFIGHDSGISHLAAAVGTPSLLLFGPTDPEIWAPANERVKTIRAPKNDLQQLSVATVRDAIGLQMRHSKS